MTVVHLASLSYHLFSMNKKIATNSLRNYPKLIRNLSLLFSCSLSIACMPRQVRAVGENNSLSVLSYNIKHGRGMDGKVDLPRIAKVIRSVSPDLVALQEIDRNCTRSGAVDLTSELGNLLGMEGRFGEFMDFQGGEYGMAVLSKFPIIEHQVHPLPTGAEPRCALEVRVNAGSKFGEISFVGIHNDWTREDFRVSQCKALLDKLDNLQIPVILAGDFNAGRESESVRLLCRSGFEILAKNKVNTFPSTLPKVEIDFIMSRGLKNKKFTHSVIDERIGSDHRPVLIEFTR